MSSDPTSPAGFGVGTGKVKPFGYTCTCRGNPGCRNPPVISVGRCNRIPVPADRTGVQLCYRMGVKCRSLRGGGGWGKSPCLCCWLGKEGWFWGREVRCSPLWARNAEVTPTALVSGVFRILKAWKACGGKRLGGKECKNSICLVLIK